MSDHDDALKKVSDLQARVAVLDVGKTNIKLSAVTGQAQIWEVLSTPNPVLQGEPWHHHDLARMGEWIFTTLADLCRRHPIKIVVPTGHGAAGVLVNDDPDELSALPQIDYEQDMPEDIRASYIPLAGSFLDRGSTIMGQSLHHARQLYWMTCHAPDKVAQARWFLSVPQYWAWRLCGVAASEYSCLGAQSHLWNVAEKCWTPIVSQYGWDKKMPPLRHAWACLGSIRPDLVRRYGLPDDISVLVGGHDSSLNLYRYHAAGMPDVRLMSSGTWSVGMCAATPLEHIDARRSMTINSDLHGRLVGGVLAMGGREFGHIAQMDHDGGTIKADDAIVDRLVARGSFALPSFAGADGPFPDSAGHGRYQGLAPQGSQEKMSMAVLYTALLSVTCLDLLGDGKTIALDGTALHDPLYASLIAALCPASDVVCNEDSHGITAGAALLATHEQRQVPLPLVLKKPRPYSGNGEALRAYAQSWGKLAQNPNHQQ